MKVLVKYTLFAALGGVDETLFIAFEYNTTYLLTTHAASVELK